MGYFRDLPNVLYQSPLPEKVSSRDYIIIKNLFRRVKFNSNISDVATVFNKYIINDGDRPDTIAEEIYGSSELDYVIILSAGINNIREDWPLRDNQVYNYALEKYGSEVKLNATHHFETNEIRDQNNRLILEEGLSITDTFKIDGPGLQYRASGAAPVTWTSIRESGNVTLTTDELGGTAQLIKETIGYEVTNLDYEIIKNEEKRNIDVLKPGYLQQFINDFKDGVKYNKNSQYISPTLITTENTEINPQ
tara:strand:+ start:1784 stop:2533 length:750 start_codon:yes stop_codon:yes gene_type:complete